MRTNLKNS